MKLKHNKKRNTAFLFEALTKELTKAILSKDSESKKTILVILKESFKKGAVLKKELSIYNSLLEGTDVSPRQAEKVYREACRQYAELDKEGIFEEQTDLINKINKMISPEVFDNFVPSFTAMATAYQLFNNDLSPKSRVILEEQMLEGMIRMPLVESKEHKKLPSDKLAMKMYLKKFNDEFSGHLLPEQKLLLQQYVNSFADNGLGLKVFLNEELIRIRGILNSNIGKNDGFGRIVETIDGFKGQWITTDMLKKIMKLQELAGEVQA